VADDEPVKLATSYLPRDITRGTVMENVDTGPGGVHVDHRAHLGPLGLEG